MSTDSTHRQAGSAHPPINATNPNQPIVTFNQTNPTPPHHPHSTVAYHQLHSVALLLVPLLTPPASTVRTLAGGLFTSGICLFSGGLYGTGTFSRWDAHGRVP